MELLNTDTNVEKFLNGDNKEEREKIIEAFLQTAITEQAKRWNVYFNIENKDRPKFWKLVDKLPEKTKEDFLKSTRHLTNTSKLDLYNKTPDKFRNMLSEYITLDLPDKTAKKPLIALLSSYFLIFMAVNLVFLVPIVTADIPEDENIQIYNMSKQVALVPSNHTVTYNFGVMDGISFDIDTHFIVLVLLAGSLGSLIHGIAKLSQNTQDGLVKQRDSLWYVSRPFLGATLAIAVYIVFRGGLLTTSDIQILNPYGIAALALLAGISTKQVTQKLKDMLESVLPTKSQESSG